MTGAVEGTSIGAAYLQRRWSEVVARYETAEADALSPADLESAATALSLLGRVDDALVVRTAAHEAYRNAAEPVGAVRCAIWNVFALMEAGERVRAGGWATRARRIADTRPSGDQTRAMVLIPDALVALFGGDAEGAADGFRAALDLVGVDDRDTATMASLGLGQALIMLGRLPEGVAQLDEAMVAVTAGELSPIASGIVYCAVIEFCWLASDVRRASEWTHALEGWCATQPDLIAYSGQCQAHRSELFRLHGAWDEALEAARAAERRLEAGDVRVSFGAYYQQAELLRLRGDLAEADALYSRAAESGWDPQPGLALLRLAEGRADSGQTLLRRTLGHSDPATRRSLLPAVVEVEIAAGDLDAARAAAEELAAATMVVPLLRATALQARGRVLLADGQHEEAFTALHASLAEWTHLNAPYESARCRMDIGRALQSLGDVEGAEAEFAVARRMLSRLDARPALALLDRLTGEAASTAGGDPGPLTSRELEVLRLVATGTTNRAISQQLRLSERTVERHLSNIFRKLDVQSRSAATAWAFEHGVT
jgi:DNA-binding NarL/FixJ family response regulator